MQASVLEPGPPQSAILGADVFVRPAETVARDLIGTTLVRVMDPALPAERAIVTETEAYLGPHDLACHAAKGRTKRTEVMFGPPGNLYVYFIYGMHWMLNVVVREEGFPAAVLIRGVHGMSGPGRVTRHLRIDGTLHGHRAAPSTGLWFEAREAPIPKRAIIATPRIGIDYAGPLWRSRKLRFLLSTDHSVR